VINLYDKDKLRKRLESKRIITHFGCWLYISGSRSKSGHGRISVNGHGYYASRLAMYVYNDFNLGSSLNILHIRECPDSRCFNPEHLYEGTQSDNRKDSAAVGTAKNQNSIKDKCDYGHELLENNLMIIIDKHKNIHRRCRICHRKQVREAAQRLRKRRVKYKDAK